MTAAERALELLADTVELPDLPVPASPREAYAAGCVAGLLMPLLTRYRTALADLAAEALPAECSTCGAVGQDLIRGVAPGTMVCVDSRACEDRFTDRDSRNRARP